MSSGLHSNRQLLLAQRTVSQRKQLQSLGILLLRAGSLEQPDALPQARVWLLHKALLIEALLQLSSFAESSV